MFYVLRLFLLPLLPTWPDLATTLTTRWWERELAPVAGDLCANSALLLTAVPAPG